MAEARARGFEDRVDVYQLANLALDLMGAETIDGGEWSRDKVEKAAREAEAIGLSDFVRQAPGARALAEAKRRRGRQEDSGGVEKEGVILVFCLILLV